MALTDSYVSWIDHRQTSVQINTRTNDKDSNPQKGRRTPDVPRSSMPWKRSKLIPLQPPLVTIPEQIRTKIAATHPNSPNETYPNQRPIAANRTLPPPPPNTTHRSIGTDRPIDRSAGADQEAGDRRRGREGEREREWKEGGNFTGGFDATPDRRTPVAVPPPLPASSFLFLPPFFSSSFIFFSRKRGGWGLLRLRCACVCVVRAWERRSRFYRRWRGEGRRICFLGFVSDFFFPLRSVIETDDMFVRRVNRVRCTASLSLVCVLFCHALVVGLMALAVRLGGPRLTPDGLPLVWFDYFFFFSRDCVSRRKV